MRPHVGTSRAIGPTWSKLGASGKQPSAETSPYVGLKPTIPQQAAGIRIEPPESVPSAASASPAASAAAEPPLDPTCDAPGRERIRHEAEVRVQRRDAVGELVQVRLADDRVASVLEEAHRLGRPVGHVVGEEDGAVGRRQAGGVEQVLDREPDPGPGIRHLGDEDPFHSL